MKVGILTGGGDVPGLNACIKSVTRRIETLGWDLIGFRRGWAGPLHCNPEDPEAIATNTIDLNRQSVRTIDRTGGTVLHTSRTNPGRVTPEDLPEFLSGKQDYNEKAGVIDCTAHVLNVFSHMKLDALIAIGGDDTLSYASRLHKEGFKVMSIPKTMDNDVYGTDYCIGFSTAVTRSVDAITALRTSSGSHERIAVIELFGRYSGETALISGYLADADRVLIAEVPFEIDRLSDLIVQDRQDNPSSYAMIVVSEGAHHAGGDLSIGGEADAYGHRKLGGIGEQIGAAVKEKTGIGIIAQRLAYIMRSGPPDSLDRMVATSYGTMAVQLLEEGKSGLMMAIRDGNYATMPGDISVQGEKRVDVDQLYDVKSYRPRIARVQGKPMFLY